MSFVPFCVDHNDNHVKLFKTCYFATINTCKLKLGIILILAYKKHISSPYNYQILDNNAWILVKHLCYNKCLSKKRKCFLSIVTTNWLVHNTLATHTRMIRQSVLLNPLHKNVGNHPLLLKSLFFLSYHLCFKKVPHCSRASTLLFSSSVSLVNWRTCETSGGPAAVWVVTGHMLPRPYSPMTCGVSSSSWAWDCVWRSCWRFLSSFWGLATKLRMAR